METATPQRHASGGPGKEPQHRNLFEAFVATVDRLGDDVAIPTENDEVAISWNELRGRAAAIAGGLAGLG